MNQETTVEELARLRKMERILKSADGIRIYACLEAMDGITDPVLAVQEYNQEAERMQNFLAKSVQKIADLESQVEKIAGMTVKG